MKLKGLSNLFSVLYHRQAVLWVVRQDAQIIKKC